MSEDRKDTGWLSHLTPIKPGAVTNPRGPRNPIYTVARYIREKTLDGRKLVNFLLAVLDGNDDKFKKTSDKLYAVKLLLDRGWGQAPETIILEVNGKEKPIIDMQKLSEQEFQAFKAIMSKMTLNRENELESQEPEIVDAEQAHTDGSGPTISPVHDPDIKP